MITEGMIYWITRLDSLNNFLDIITFILSLILIAGITSLVASWIVSFDDDDAKKVHIEIRKVFFPILFIWIIVITVCIFIPTTKEMVAIYAVPQITSNKDIQEIPPNVAKIVNKQLKEWMSDMLDEGK